MDSINKIDLMPDGTLARKIIYRSRASVATKYPSWKMGRFIHAESKNELNAFILLDANPAVASFREQPAIIEYVMDGTPHKHFPDILVVLTDGSMEFWEVKPKEQAVKPEVLARTRLMTELLPQQGYAYRVVIGEDLATQPRLKNALKLLRLGRQNSSSLDVLATTQLLQLDPRWGSHTPESGVHKFIAKQYLQGNICIDLNYQINPETKLVIGG